MFKFLYIIARNWFKTLKMFIVLKYSVVIYEC